MAESNNSLKKVIDAIKGAADDLATLEVYTFTGSLSAAPTDEATGKIKWSELSKQAATGGELKLVAATKLYPDYDSDYFQTADLTIPDRQALIASHHEAVRTAADSRNAFISLVGSALGLTSS